MLSEKMQGALNQQINAEFYSAYLYLSMSAYFQSSGLTGFAAWMKAQAAEEMIHAIKFYGYVNGRGGRVNLGAVEAPPTTWDSPMAVFQDTLAHEQKVTGLINGLVTMAKSENDHATEIFLQWFISEQVEEEASAEEVINKLKLLAAAPGGLFMMDNELGKRAINLAPLTAPAA